MGSQYGSSDSSEDELRSTLTYVTPEIPSTSEHGAGHIPDHKLNIRNSNMSSSKNKQKVQSLMKDSSGGFNVNAERKMRRSSIGPRGLLNCKGSVECVLPQPKETPRKFTTEVQSTNRHRTKHMSDHKSSTGKSKISSQVSHQFSEHSLSPSSETSSSHFSYLDKAQLHRGVEYEGSDSFSSFSSENGRVRQSKKDSSGRFNVNTAIKEREGSIEPLGLHNCKGSVACISPEPKEIMAKFGIAIYFGGEISVRRHCGVVYTLPPVSTLPVYRNITFEEVKSLIFQRLGFQESKYLIDIQCRVNIAPKENSNLYFDVITVHDDNSWKLACQMCLKLVQLYVRMDPIQNIRNNQLGRNNAPHFICQQLDIANSLPRTSQPSLSIISCAQPKESNYVSFLANSEIDNDFNNDNDDDDEDTHGDFVVERGNSDGEDEDEDEDEDDEDVNENMNPGFVGTDSSTQKSRVKCKDPNCEQKLYGKLVGFLRDIIKSPYQHVCRATSAGVDDSQLTAKMIADINRKDVKKNQAISIRRRRKSARYPMIMDVSKGRMRSRHCKCCTINHTKNECPQSNIQAGSSEAGPSTSRTNFP